ncbi:hypothetical protein ASD88_08480 [Pelomonas sp. Root662]|nr:hypothetical protein ASC81_08480 [Pelomonas sp. Root405]KRA73480.1 hypothetical protein ASD88_08480 [Pelomonas sp. Root662]
MMAVSLAGAALLFIAMTYGSAETAAIAATLAGPAIAVPWAGLCACIWFHPQRGNMQPGNRFIGRLPNAVQLFFRWYASLFLAAFVLMGLVVWPALALAWL